ncbi:MAG TPA: fibrobacter succinogenes major paralogous domain-containing protein [Tenuifilaceae bacterium]|nr:fibrobacter succinogenes major paralogous domain-containing protein [Tenuifilaceae bacterium]
MKTKRYSCNRIILGSIIILLFISCKKEENGILYGTVSDIDGNTYKTVKIGNQWWMAENLRVTRFRNGDPIPHITYDNYWYDRTSSACCNYENNPSNALIYGKLYNWYAATDARNICPIGWHLPNETEWLTLISFLGGKETAGGKLKEVSTTYWMSPNSGANNETGFTALPGGARLSTGSFEYIGYHSWWWCSTEVSSGAAWNIGLYHNKTNVDKSYTNKPTGISIRCIKD